MLRSWDELPIIMQDPQVRRYWEALDKKRFSLVLKRVFDLVMALILLIVLAIPMLIVAVIIKADSKGPVLFRQERVTAYGKIFRIHKFRTMAVDSDKNGSAVTVKDDSRITRTGAVLRRLRIDEFPQLLDVLSGSMTFVGTRPEVLKYVEQYRPEYYATLLLPAGITSEASIRFKDEQELLEKESDADKVYLEYILPQKMDWNLKYIKDYSIAEDLSILARTCLAVLGKED